MSLTDSQRRAVESRGNVLVVAGAGTGKTHTLVERCLACLLEEKPRASLDEILMVTFTDAAAAEMRQRIRSRIEDQIAAHTNVDHWQEQLARFETAHIGTLHSFCLKLVREHFYQLELDPQLSVMPEEEARLVAEETLEDLLQKHYAGRGPEAVAVQHLIQSQGRGWDKPIRALILRLHHYTQTLPDPLGWIDSQLEMFGHAQPMVWEKWFVAAAEEWRDRWLPILKPLSLENDVAAACLGLLNQSPALNSRPAAATFLERIAIAHRECPPGKKGLWLKPLERFLDEARFLASLASGQGKTDPLAEDWNWVRPQMATLLRLTRQFSENFSDSKHELGMVDFHDLEQHALRLLWDSSANQPTPIARQWRKKLRFIFVDEYQDINAAQDKIIQALSRESSQANRFLVGDVKQSIYRFRLANPRIFQNYLLDWADGRGTAIPLTENFRSRERLLEFVNSLFGMIMRTELGGVSYGEQARLVFGAPSSRASLSATTLRSPCVELHLRVKQRNSDAEERGPDAELPAEVADLDDADKEARLVAIRLRELHAAKHSVWDEERTAFRAIEWRDMAILLRSPAGKVESYAKEFSRLDVPLQVARGGFYQSLEISDLVSLLQTLDNPLQDIPVLAVLHSPLVGLTLNELATIRLTVMKAHFWTALVRWSEGSGPARSAAEGARRPKAGQEKGPLHETRLLHEKVAAFLERFARWRRLARQVSLSRCLEAVLSETHYADWLLTQVRGEQRRANVQRLLTLAQQFDQFQRQGLFRFLRFIEAQQAAEAEPQVSVVSDENAVRLMSIHQSKGLEFPVVVVADLGKAFNLLDLRAEIILDETYGLCPQVKPPQTGKRYPSLPYWLARERQLRELLGEEIRLLYVAMTRARDTLLLAGTVPEGKFNKHWKGMESGRNPIPDARSYADWLGVWFAKNCSGGDADAPEGVHTLLHWFIHGDGRLTAAVGTSCGLEEMEPAQPGAPDAAVWKALERKLSWQYPFAASTRQPAKASVSELRRRAAALVEDEDGFSLRPLLAGRGAPSARSPSGSPLVHSPKPARQPTDSKRGDGGDSKPADIGTAHHRFLQLVSLDQTDSQSALQKEVKRLQKESLLTDQEIALLDLGNLAEFWKSKLGRRVVAHAQFVHRELAFTTRFAPMELSGLTGETAAPALEGEFIVVQGVADLVIIRPEEIWLLDFKTDNVTGSEVAHRVREYAPQLRIYALALSRIYGRPVSECWLAFLTSRRQVPIEPT